MTTNTDLKNLLEGDISKIQDLKFQVLATIRVCGQDLYDATWKIHHLLHQMWFPNFWILFTSTFLVSAWPSPTCRRAPHAGLITGGRQPFPEGWKRSGREKDEKGPKIQKQRKKRLFLGGKCFLRTSASVSGWSCVTWLLLGDWGSVATFKVKAGQVNMNDNGFEVSINSLPRGPTKGVHCFILLTGH